MSEEERGIILRHGAYWRELQNNGVALVFGPVIYPKGVWGVGIIEVNSESEAQEYTSNGPAIKTGMNKL